MKTCESDRPTPRKKHLDMNEECTSSRRKESSNQRISELSVEAREQESCWFRWSLSRIGFVRSNSPSGKECWQSVWNLNLTVIFSARTDNLTFRLPKPKPALFDNQKFKTYYVEVFAATQWFLVPLRNQCLLQLENIKTQCVPPSQFSVVLPMQYNEVEHPKRLIKNQVYKRIGQFSRFGYCETVWKRSQISGQFTRNWSMNHKNHEHTTASMINLFCLNVRRKLSQNKGIVSSEKRSRINFLMKRSRNPKHSINWIFTGSFVGQKSNEVT